MIDVPNWHADTKRACENGELRQAHVTLQICINGSWKTVCPSLWGQAQAIVACRQLNPGRTVTGKTANINIDFIDL